MNRFKSEAPRIAAIIRRTVPALADFCLVYVLRGHRLRCIASAHATPAGDRLLRAFARAYRITRHDPDSTVAQVVRLGRYSLRGAIPTERDVLRPRLPRLGRIFALHRQLAVRSALVVPIEHDGAVLGAMVFSYSISGRRYSTADLTVAERCARRAARALDAAVPLHELGVPQRKITRMVRLRARA